MVTLYDLIWLDIERTVEGTLLAMTWEEMLHATKELLRTGYCANIHARFHVD